LKAHPVALLRHILTPGGGAGGRVGQAKARAKSVQDQSHT
jgi:hypothetical protein